MEVDGSIYGESVFVSFRWDTCRIAVHQQRLLDSVKFYFGLKSLGNIKIIIKDFCESISLYENKRIRIRVTPKSRSYVFQKKFVANDLEVFFEQLPVGKKRDSVRCKVIESFRSCALEKIKLLSYGENFYLRRLSQAEGFDDYLGVQSNGNILEASTSNILLKHKGTWMTPRSNIYKGLTRQLLLDQGKIIESSIHQSFIADCEEAYLLNSIEGVVAIDSIDSRNFFNESYQEVREWVRKR